MASTYLDRVDNKTLGEMLVEKGALSEEQVQEALEVARQNQIRLGEALISLGYIGTDALSYAIAEQYGQRPMELHPSMVDAELLSRFDPELLWRHTLLPLVELANELVVVVADPNDQAGLNALAKQSGNKTLAPQLGAPSQIRRCLRAALPLPGTRTSSSTGARPVSATGSPDASATADQIDLTSCGDFHAGPDPECATKIFALAAKNWGRDVIVREVADALHIALLPGAAERSQSSAGVSVHTTLPGGSFGSIFQQLVKQAVRIPYTNGTAWTVNPQGSLDGHTYTFLVLHPPTPGPASCRIRALRAGAADTVASSGYELSGPGHLTKLQHDSARSADAVMTNLVKSTGLQHVPLVFSTNLRTVIPGAVVFPWPFTDAAAAIQAHGATAVYFDFMPSEEIISALSAAIRPIPAFAAYAPRSNAPLQPHPSVPDGSDETMVDSVRPNPNNPGGSY